MKKILVCTGSFFGHENAMSNVINPLLKRLKKDFEVIDVFTIAPNGELPLEENVEGYNVYRNYNSGTGKLQKAFRKFKNLMIRARGLDQRTITKRKYIFFVKVAIGFLNLFSDKFFNAMLNLGEKKPWFHTVEELVEKNNYDVVLSISSPIRNHVDCLETKIKGKFKDTKWITYFIDPFATYKGNLEKPCKDLLMSFEEEVYKYCDAVITTPEIKRDNQKYPTGVYDEKVYPLQFGNLNTERIIEESSYFDKSKYNIFFSGSFFDISIRNPKYFFMTLKELPQDIQVYIACYLNNSLVEEYKKEYLDGKDNIHWLGRIDIKKSFEMMNEADVLVNVGNESSNQTPSKIFDYISLCKPIINYYSLEDDTTKHYLEKYPSKLNILNKEEIDTKDIDQLKDFIYNSKNVFIEKKDIRNIYNEMTSESTSEEFVRIIKTVMGEHKK